MSIKQILTKYGPIIVNLTQNGAIITWLSSQSNISASSLIIIHGISAALTSAYFAVVKTPAVSNNLVFLANAKKLSIGGKDGKQVTVLSGACFNDPVFADGATITTSAINTYDQATGIYTSNDNISYKCFNVAKPEQTSEIPPAK